MRLLLASLLFLVATLNLRFGADQTSLEIAAFAGAILLCLTMILDLLWLDPKKGRRRDEPLATEPQGNAG